jgi:hypothetical protein
MASGSLQTTDLSKGAAKAQVFDEVTPIARRGQLRGELLQTQSGISPVRHGRPIRRRWGFNQI